MISQLDVIIEDIKESIPYLRKLKEGTRRFRKLVIGGGFRRCNRGLRREGGRGRGRCQIRSNDGRGRWTSRRMDDRGYE